MKRPWIAFLLIAFALLQQGGAVMAAISHASEMPQTEQTGVGCHADTAMPSSETMQSGISHDDHLSTDADTSQCCTFDCEWCVGGCSSTLPVRSSFGSLLVHRAMPDLYARHVPLVPGVSLLRPPIFV